MKIAIIGASGKTGTKLVKESLNRGDRVTAVCRNSSANKLALFFKKEGFSMITAPVISNENILTQALEGCDAMVAILISVRQLKSTDLISSLEKATYRSGVKRLIFTAGEVTTIPENGEKLTLRQKLLLTIVPSLLWFTPYSMTDMLKASVMIKQNPEWDWTILRAPTLNEKRAVGYKFCDISEVTSAHKLAREDYAVCLLDSINNKAHFKRCLTVISADSNLKGKKV